MFTIKTNENGEPSRFKARLVARGFMQKEGIDFEETYAPVAKLSTVRILLATSLQKGFAVHQMDVKTAFLRGSIEEDVYIKVPDGFNESDDVVYKLLKALYGLKQAPRCWNREFNAFIKSLGFVRSKHDPCLYVLFNGDDVVYLLLYVDDILIAAKRIELINKLKRKLKKKFEMVDLGEVKSFLGIKINYDCKNGVLELSQAGAIDKLLEKFQMNECRSVQTPMVPNQNLVPSIKKKPLDKPYRELIGSLMYIMLATRPDLCYVVAYLSRFQDKADENHWNALKNVLKYLKGTKNYGLCYKRNVGAESLVGYVDADFASDISDRKSTTGYIFEVFGCSVVWYSKKQGVVTVSTTEAEYVAASLATCEALWIRGILQDLKVEVINPTKIFEDNQSCIKMSRNQDSKRSKHIDVRCHHIRDNVEKGIIILQYKPSSEQKADMMTKPLQAVQFQKLIKAIGLKAVTERGY